MKCTNYWSHGVRRAPGCNRSDFARELETRPGETLRPLHRGILSGLLPSLVLLVACGESEEASPTPPTVTPLTTPTTGPDLDGDGYSDTDCDDSDAQVHPGALEVCNGLDDNCDMVTDVDAVDRQELYRDFDADSYGNAFEMTVMSCYDVAGYTVTSGDCDDENPDVHSGALEVCNGLDDNCDWVTDVDAVDRQELYRDFDMDGFGDADATTVKSCDDVVGYADIAGDCDDQNPDIYPAAQETCNGIDDDCDGQADSCPTSRLSQR